MADSSTEKEYFEKVFIFTPPRFETTQISLQEGQAKNQKRKCFDWKISHFDIDLTKSKPESKRSKALSKNASGSLVQLNESNHEESEINLEYDFEEMRNSVMAYLDSTFNTENSKQIEASQAFISEAYSDSTNISSDTTDTCKKTVQQEFMNALHESEKLLGESQGFIEMSVDETQKFQQTSNSQTFSTQSDTLSIDSSNSYGDHKQKISLSSSITKLSSCTQNDSKVNIFAVVLQVNPMKEMLMKSGVNSGQYVRLSSILVGDCTKEYFKLTFWRKSAEWANALVAGDVVVVKKVKIGKWQNEFYGQTTYETTLVNLKRDSSHKIPPHWLTFVRKSDAKSLMSWVNFRHPYLGKPSATCKGVTWQTLLQFTANTLVHYRAKIVKVLTYNSSSGSYTFGYRKLNKVMAIAVDAETSEEIPICLWGRQENWQYELKTKIGQVWDFKFLYVDCKGVHGDLVLHTTPQSTKSNQQSSVFTTPTQDNKPSPFSCISYLLKANCTGKVSVSSVNITSISVDKTLVDDNPVLSIDETSNLETVVRFFQQLVYLGCKSCLQALQKDDNCIYTHCSFCLKNPNSHTFGVKYCYKQITIRLTDLSASIFTRSCHEATARLMKTFDPQDLLEGTCSNELYEFVCNTFSRDYKPKVYLNCETKLDENDFVVKQTFEFIHLYL